MVNLSKKIVYSACGACAGLAGLAAGGAGCSGSCPSCFGCAAAGTGIIVAALFGKFGQKKEEENGLA